MLEAPKVKFPRNTTVRDLPRFFSFEEADALVAASGEDPEWGPLVIVGLRTGLRISELLALRWADVELTGTPRLNVTRGAVDGFESAPKSGKGRPVPLSGQACAVLKAHRVRNPKAKLVFGNPDDTWRTRHQATNAIHRLCDAAKVARAGIHTTRHTFASHLAMRGVPLVQIRDLLGHASIQLTEVYARLQPGHGSAAAVALLDGIGKSASARR
jgi:integrase